MKKYVRFLVVFVFFAFAKAIKAQPSKVTSVQEMESPNGNFKLEMRLNAIGTPVYKLNFLGKEVIKESSLGFDLKGDNKSL
ncbi:MAG: glycoside hydrolase family 97 N-terminal domain-containing protein, partial [Nonlabens sp.]|nr:glycoside hydrolase family 97 N-terminal domain-containing protein [Nonlabens sp.]